MDKMKIITFHSYKGGTGKTTLSINLAKELAEREYKVLLVDGDFKAPTFQHLFKKSTPKNFLNQLLEETSNLTMNDLIVKSFEDENLDLIFSWQKPQFGKGVLSLDKEWHAKAFRRLLNEIKKLSNLKLYDFMIIDSTPGVDFSALNFIILSDVVLIVLRPSNYDIDGTLFMIDTLYSQVGDLKRIDAVIFNQVPPNTPQYFIDEWTRIFEKTHGMKIINMIPISLDVATEAVKGHQVFHKNMDVKSHVQELADEILTLMKQ